MIGIYFEPIIAPPFNEGLLRLHMLNEGRKIMTEMKKDFGRTVKTWNTKPKFEHEIGFSKTQLKLYVFTEDENYARVSEGTKGKPRFAKGIGPGMADAGAKALTIFPYTPKTTAGVLNAKPGGAAEGPITFRRYAILAGEIEPRKFDDLVYEIWEEKLPERLQQTFDTAADASGYAF